MVANSQRSCLAPCLNRDIDSTLELLVEFNIENVSDLALNDVSRQELLVLLVLAVLRNCLPPCTENELSLTSKSVTYSPFQCVTDSGCQSRAGGRSSRPSSARSGGRLPGLRSIENFCTCFHLPASAWPEPVSLA